MTILQYLQMGNVTTQFDRRAIFARRKRKRQIEIYPSQSHPEWNVPVYTDSYGNLYTRKRGTEDVFLRVMYSEYSHSLIYDRHGAHVSSLEYQDRSSAPSFR